MKSSQHSLLKTALSLGTPSHARAFSSLGQPGEYLNKCPRGFRCALKGERYSLEIVFYSSNQLVFTKRSRPGHHRTPVSRG